MKSDFCSLRKNQDFRLVYRQGRSRANRLFVMLIKKNGLDHNRVGFSVSKKVGNSVIRHKIIRRLREIMRLSWNNISKGYDIVIIVREPAGQADYREMESAIFHLLKIHHL